MAQSYVWSAFKAGLVHLRGLLLPLLLLPLLLLPPRPESPLANSPSGPGCFTEARGTSMVSVFPFYCMVMVLGAMGRMMAFRKACMAPTRALTESPTANSILRWP
jgi:hypothetical protein